MWMAPLGSSKQHTKVGSWSTSTPWTNAYNLLLEDTRADGSMPFLGTLVIPHPDCSLATAVYRRPTHTYQYLQWDSRHTISDKDSVVRALHDRVRAVCSSPQLLCKGEYLQEVLSRCSIFIGLEQDEDKEQIPYQPCQ